VRRSGCRFPWHVKMRKVESGNVFKGLQLCAWFLRKVEFGNDSKGLQVSVFPPPLGERPPLCGGLSPPRFGGATRGRKGHGEICDQGSADGRRDSRRRAALHVAPGGAAYPQGRVFDRAPCVAVPMRAMRGPVRDADAEKRPVAQPTVRVSQ